MKLTHWERCHDGLGRADAWGPSPMSTTGGATKGRQVHLQLRMGALALALAATGCGPGWALQGSRSATEAKQQATPRPDARKSPVSFEKATDVAGIFLLDGKPMCFLGSNNYYLIFKSQKMVDDVLDTSKAMGIKVFRHWAFTDRGSLDGSVAAMDGDGTKEGYYFQYWDSAAHRPAYNDGERGLEKLDYLLYKARQNDIRIVMVLTNNWRDFGGMDQYLTWYGLSKHHEFYTDERVKQAYKDYVTHLVHRVNKFTGIAYKDDPYIFAWNLANEPRMRNYAGYDSPDGWKPDTVTQWASEMSDYIRSIDPHHMISVGDEGFFMKRAGALYSGEDGVDHDALIGLENIDYTTFHLYPDHWAQGLPWGDQWIEDHLSAARHVGKPAVLEEYNVAVKRNDANQEIISGGERREKALSRWHDLVQLRGGSGAMFWMLAGYDDYQRAYYKDYDHFTVYTPKIDVTGRAMQEFGGRMRSQAQACEAAASESRLLEPKRAVPPGFVTTSRPEVVREINAASSPTGEAPVRR